MMLHVYLNNVSKFVCFLIRIPLKRGNLCLMLRKNSLLLPPYPVVSEAVQENLTIDFVKKHAKKFFYVEEYLTLTNSIENQHLK